jgi:membrane-bound lytic murein transglycosylase A
MPPRQFLPSGLSAIGFAELHGWHEDDHHQALVAFQRSLPDLLQTVRGRWTGLDETDLKAFADHACRAHNAKDAREFFETWFKPCRVQTNAGEGLFTGYYEPLLHGRRVANQNFPVPVYARPDDLVQYSPGPAEEKGLAWGRTVCGQIQPYDTRKEIEQGSLAGRARIICWLDSWIDAFFLHVQGSGRVVLENGQVLRLGYAAKSGWPYTSIGAVLIARGAIPVAAMSMQQLRHWLSQDGQRARELMWENKSYIFFRELEELDPALGALGTAGVQLTPGRSLALDAAVWPMGLPFWLDVQLPGGAKPEAMRRLMVMQDTGSAITGVVRGDVYWGWGPEAEWWAGHMKSRGVLTVLLPRFLPGVMEMAA